MQRRNIDVSMNLEIKQRQRRIQSTHRTNAVIQNVNLRRISRRLNSCSTAIHTCRASQMLLPSPCAIVAYATNHSMLTCTRSPSHPVFGVIFGVLFFYNFPHTFVPSNDRCVWWFSGRSEPVDLRRRQLERRRRRPGVDPVGREPALPRPVRRRRRLPSALAPPRRRTPRRHRVCQLVPRISSP